MVGAEPAERAACPGSAAGGSGAAGAPPRCTCAGAGSRARGDPADSGASVGISAGGAPAVADPDVQAAESVAVAFTFAESVALTESHTHAGTQPVAHPFTFAGADTYSAADTRAHTCAGAHCSTRADAGPYTHFSGADAVTRTYASDYCLIVAVAESPARVRD